METEPQQRLPEKAISAWRVGGMLRSLFIWLIPLGFWLFDTQNSISIWIYITLLVVALLLSLLFIFWIPAIRWRRWRYDIDEHEIDLQRGLIVVQRTLVPINRVQHVDTRQGPILRNYNLSDVVITTAATTHQIPALTDEIADTVRSNISTFARRAKEDV